MTGLFLRDAWSLLRSLTPARLWNLMLLYGAEVMSRIRKEAILAGSPAYVHIEPTSFCNLHCPECPTGLGLLQRPRGRITVKTFETFLDTLAPKAFYLTLYFQGEPLLHPDFPDLVRRAKQRRLYVVTSSNLQGLDESRAYALVRSGLDRLIVSFDGPDKETYERYRTGGDWEQLKAAVTLLRNARDANHGRGPLLVLQCLLMQQNEFRQDEVRRLAIRLGADKVEFKTLQLCRTAEVSELLPTQERYTRYRWTDDGGYVLKQSPRKACHRVFSSLVVCWDGTVVPCCYDKDAGFSLGRLDQQQLNGIWKGTPRRDFVNSVMRSRRAMGMCINCEE